MSQRSSDEHSDADNRSLEANAPNRISKSSSLKAGEIFKLNGYTLFMKESRDGRFYF